MDADEARRRLASARVAHLATVRPDGRPHVVPVCFVVLGDTAYSAVDQKPKRHAGLQRLANLDAQPSAALLADGYDEDWTELWWVRADCTARRAADSEAATAKEALHRRYDQYANHELGAVIALDIDALAGWSAS